MFAGILAGCMAVLLLVILMPRFPPRFGAGMRGTREWQSGTVHPVQRAIQEGQPKGCPLRLLYHFSFFTKLLTTSE